VSGRRRQKGQTQHKEVLERLERLEHLLQRHRMDPLMETEEAQRYLGVKRDYLFKLINSGQLPSVRIARKRRVRLSAVNAFIEALERSRHGKPGRRGKEIDPPSD
jgi:excisionase family DNA binding protein